MDADKYNPLMTRTELLLSEPDRFDNNKIRDAVSSLTEEEKEKISRKLQSSSRSCEREDMDLVRSIRKKTR